MGFPNERCSQSRVRSRIRVADSARIVSRCPGQGGIFHQVRHNEQRKLRKRALRWRYNGHDCVSNNQPHDCLLNRLFRHRSKKTLKLRVTALCAGNSTGTGEFPAQKGSYAENVSIWWRHHGIYVIMSRRLQSFKADVQCQVKQYDKQVSNKEQQQQKIKLLFVQCMFDAHIVKWVILYHRIHFGKKVI